MRGGCVRYSWCSTRNGYEIAVDFVAGLRSSIEELSSAAGATIEEEFVPGHVGVGAVECQWGSDVFVRCFLGLAALALPLYRLLRTFHLRLWFLPLLSCVRAPFLCSGLVSLLLVSVLALSYSPAFGPWFHHLLTRFSSVSPPPVSRFCLKFFTSFSLSHACARAHCVLLFLSVLAYVWSEWGC